MHILILSTYYTCTWWYIFSFAKKITVWKKRKTDALSEVRTNNLQIMIWYTQVYMYMYMASCTLFLLPHCREKLWRGCQWGVGGFWGHCHSRIVRLWKILL